MPSKKEEPLPDVAGANVGRSDTTPFRREPEAGKSCEDGSKSMANKPRDIFKEDEPGLALLEDPFDVGPEPTLVVGPESLAGGAERLTRESRSDDIHDSTPRAAVEGSQIRPDRRFTQPSRSALCRQVLDGEGFPLHHADDARIRNGELESEGQTAVPGT